MAIRVIRRDGKPWRYEVRCRGVDGRQQMRRFGTRREAESHEAMQRLARLRGAGELRADQLTFGQLADLWREDYRTLVRETSDRSQWARWQMLAPHVGSVRLDQLRSGHLDDAFRRLATERRGERHHLPPYAPSTLEGCRTVVAQILRWARERGIIEREIVALMRPIPASGSGTQRAMPEAWSLEEVRRVVRWADEVLQPEEATRFLGRPSRLRDGAWRHTTEARPLVIVPLLLFTLWTGLRSGESRALTWERVTGESVQVRQTWTQPAGGAATLGPPKTRASRRDVALSPMARSVLDYQRDRQRDRRDHRLGMGIGWAASSDAGWLFDNGMGDAVDPQLLDACCRYVAKQVGVKVLTPHGLRHTFATISLEAGVPVKVVSEMLGHASVMLTIDLYSHVTTDLQRLAADLLDRAVTGGGDGGSDRTWIALGGERGVRSLDAGTTE